MAGSIVGVGLGGGFEHAVESARLIAAGEREAGGAWRTRDDCLVAAGLDRSPAGYANMCSCRYVELHCHSAFSFLDGASLPDELVTAAVRAGTRRSR